MVWENAEWPFWVKFMRWEARAVCGGWAVLTVSLSRLSSGTHTWSLFHLSLSSFFLSLMDNFWVYMDFHMLYVALHWFCFNSSSIVDGIPSIYDTLQLCSFQHSGLCRVEKWDTSHVKFPNNVKKKKKSIYAQLFLCSREGLHVCSIKTPREDMRVYSFFSVHLT